MSLDRMMGGIDKAISTIGKLGNQIQDFNIAQVPRMGVEALLSGKNPLSRQNPNPPSPYATDLSYTKYAPKPRFLFKVLFTFQQEYAGNFKTREFNFLIKKIDKPKVKFEYEDANFYNYRTKVLKKISYDPLQMIFIDDSDNTVVDFFEFYRRAHSPITWKGYGQAGAAPTILENSGMDFQVGRARGLKNGYGASVGTLQGGHRFILKNIKLIEFYQHGIKHNVYYFVNPRLLSMDFDGSSDHEDGTSGHGLNVSFDFDYLFTEAYHSFNNEWTFGKYDLLGGGGVKSPLLNRVLDNVFGLPDETSGSNKNIFSQEPGGFDFGNMGGMLGGMLGGAISKTGVGSMLGGLGDKLSSGASSLMSDAKNSIASLIPTSATNKVGDLGGHYD